MKTLGRLSLAMLAMLMLACGSKPSKELDTPFKGEVSVAVDESFMPILDAEKTAFTQMYKEAKVKLVYKPENEAIADMLNGKVRFAVVTRELTDKEKQVFVRDKIQYRSFKMFADGIALITNKDNKDTLITLKEIEALMKGTKKKWNQIGKGGKSEDVVLVFDSVNSSNLTFLMNKFGITSKDKVPIYATKSNEEVIEYVKNTQ